MPSVEQIQDIVEEVLISSPHKRTAKAYIIYRDQHARIREIVSKADVDLIDRYLERADWQVNENSNMAYSLQGLNNYVSSEVSKVYWLNKIYPPEVRQAHTDGDFHIHDLGILSVYCVGWDLEDLLLQGFKGAAGKVESKPAKHLRSALGQIVNFFYTLQGEAAGAQAFSHFDTLLAPFIRFDGLDFDGVKQALQEFVFNINVPTRVGFQTPFTNITLDLHVPAMLPRQAGHRRRRVPRGDLRRLRERDGASSTAPSSRCCPRATPRAGCSPSPSPPTTSPGLPLGRPRARRGSGGSRRSTASPTSPTS